MGDSAGGALILAMAMRLRDEDGPRPASLVALSPWLDATLDEESVEDLEATDPMLAESGLRAAGRWWASPHDPSYPLVSPVHADLGDLPPDVARAPGEERAHGSYASCILAITASATSEVPTAVGSSRVGFMS